MSITETRPDAPATPGPSAADPVQAEPAGFGAWLVTADHKRIGRLFIATAVVTLVLGSVVGALLGAEGIDSGLDLFEDDTFGQVYTLHGEVAVFGFLVPLFLGLATYLVPLQVGSSDIAFPRGSAAAYWAHLIGIGLLVGAYAANGGPTGGSDIGVDLHLTALGLLNVATCVALVSVLTTIASLRAPGMTLRRTPSFSWSVLVGGGLTLLACPVLVARLIEAYIGHHFGDAAVDYAGVRWFWTVPTLFLLVVPAAGVAAEVVPVLARSPFRQRDAVLVVLGLLGVFGFGAYAQLDHTIVRAGMGIAALLPALGLLGLLGDAVRRGSFAFRAPLLLALGAVVHLVLGALAGATAMIEPLELEGTAWESAVVHYTLYGAATLAGFAALWYWAPKLWGVHLGEGAGKVVFLCTFLGALGLSAPDLVNGLVEDLPLGVAAAEFDDSGLAVAMNVLSLLGGLLGVLGVLVAFGDLLGKVVRRRGRPAGDDPWDGHTLEWATASPPPPGNFAEPVAPVSSPWPLLSRS